MLWPATMTHAVRRLPTKPPYRPLGSHLARQKLDVSRDVGQAALQVPPAPSLLLRLPLGAPALPLLGLLGALRGRRGLGRRRTATGGGGGGGRLGRADGGLRLPSGHIDAVGACPRRLSGLGSGLWPALLDHVVWAGSLALSLVGVATHSGSSVYEEQWWPSDRCTGQSTGSSAAGWVCSPGQ